MQQSPWGPVRNAGDLADLPDDDLRHELVTGLLVSEPLPAHRHDRVRRRLERILDGFVAAHALGEVFGAAGYVLSRDPDTVRGPDLSFVASDRLSGFDDTRFFEGAPDLAVEIRSPSNQPGEMRAKAADYLAAGTRVVWVVDPGSREVTVHRDRLVPVTVGTDGHLEADELFPGLRIPVSNLFVDPHAPGL